MNDQPHIWKPPFRWDDYEGVCRDSENWAVPARDLIKFANAHHQSLSQEAVREEVLEEPCRYCNAIGNDPCAYPEGCKRLDNLVLRMLNTAIHSDTQHPPAGALLREAVAAIRKLASALKREPNAAAEGIANVTLPVFSNERRIRNGFRNPERRGTAAASDTKEMMEEIERSIRLAEGLESDVIIVKLPFVRKLLAKLGQGWVSEGECCCAAHHPNHGRCLQCPIHGTLR